MPDLILLFVTVPVVTGLIGWVTNWAAVKMIFHPKHFLGVGPVGWQGILYKQSHKFATGVADMATNNLITPKSLFERVDLDEMETLLSESLDQETAGLCKHATELIRPGSWDALPEPVKAMIIAQVKQKTREMSRELFGKLEDNADELIDLHKLIYAQLSGGNADRLADFTMQIGRKEFKFIEYYGGVFGFLIGMMQIGMWSVMQTWWLMPIVGAIVGLVTNWLAIQMIFRPQQPKRYLGLVTYQGLFAKRQPEIARDYGQVAGGELLTPKNLLTFLAQGEGGVRIALLITQTISARIDEEWNKVKPMIPVVVTAEMLASIKALIVQRLMATAPSMQPKIETYLGDKLAVCATVEDRLSSLSKPDFERILRGIFEEDEITLILVGGVLGAAVGVLQGMMVLTI